MGPADVNQEIIPSWKSLIDPPTTPDPGWRSDALHSGAEDLNEPLFSPPEPKMHKKVLTGYKPAYKGVKYNKN